MENDSNNARILRKTRGGQTSLRVEVLKRILLTDNYIYTYMTWVTRERFCNAEYIIAGKLSLGAKHRTQEPTTKRNAPGCGICIEMRSGAIINEISLWQPWLHFCYFVLTINDDVYIYIYLFIRLDRVGFSFREVLSSHEVWSLSFLRIRETQKRIIFGGSDRRICTRQRNKRRDRTRSRYRAYVRCRSWCKCDSLFSPSSESESYKRWRILIEVCNFYDYYWDNQSREARRNLQEWRNDESREGSDDSHHCFSQSVISSCRRTRDQEIIYRRLILVDALDPYLPRRATYRVTRDDNQRFLLL